jgi:hypothetical protein
MKIFFICFLVLLGVIVLGGIVFVALTYKFDEAIETLSEIYIQPMKEREKELKHIEIQIERYNSTIDILKPLEKDQNLCCVYLENILNRDVLVQNEEFIREEILFYAKRLATNAPIFFLEYYYYNQKNFFTFIEWLIKGLKP